MSIWDVGLAYLLKGEKDPITLKANQTPARGLHFVDENGATLVPLYVADAVPLPGQAPAGGFKITIPGAGAIATLQADVANANANIAALDARVSTQENVETPFVKTYTADPLVIDWGATDGKRHVKIDVGATPLTIAASMNAIEGFSYRLTLLGGGGGYAIDTMHWIPGSLITTALGGFPVFGGDDTERIVFDFAFTEGKMRCMGVHYSDDA